MITEDYVSFETAKLLKEKGFPLPSTNFKDWMFCMYDENENIHWGCYHPDWYARVTLQMAMKWLREIHNINLNIIFIKRFDKGYWNKGYWTFNNLSYGTTNRSIYIGIYFLSYCNCFMEKIYK